MALLVKVIYQGEKKVLNQKNFSSLEALTTCIEAILKLNLAELSLIIKSPQQDVINSLEDMQNAFAIQEALGSKSITLSIEPNLSVNLKESFFAVKR